MFVGLELRGRTVRLLGRASFVAASRSSTSRSSTAPGCDRDWRSSRRRCGPTTPATLPFRQWSIGNESHGVLLDDPTEAWRRAYGSPVPVTFDVEWGSDERPDRDRSRLRADRRHRCPHRADRGRARARRARPPRARVGRAVPSLSVGDAGRLGRVCAGRTGAATASRRPGAHSDGLARTYCRRMSRDILDEFEQQRRQPDYPTMVAARRRGRRGPWLRLLRRHRHDHRRSGDAARPPGYARASSATSPAGSCSTASRSRWSASCDRRRRRP